MKWIDDDFNRNTLIDMVREGFTQKEIGELFGFSGAMAYQYLKEYEKFYGPLPKRIKCKGCERYTKVNRNKMCKNCTKKSREKYVG